VSSASAWTTFLPLFKQYMAAWVEHTHEFAQWTDTNYDVCGRSPGTTKASSQWLNWDVVLVGGGVMVKQRRRKDRGAKGWSVRRGFPIPRKLFDF